VPYSAETCSPHIHFGFGNCDAPGYTCQATCCQFAGYIDPEPYASGGTTSVEMGVCCEEGEILVNIQGSTTNNDPFCSLNNPIINLIHSDRGMMVYQSADVFCGSGNYLNAICADPQYFSSCYVGQKTDGFFIADCCNDNEVFDNELGCVNPSCTDNDIDGWGYISNYQGCLYNSFPDCNDNNALINPSEAREEDTDNECSDNIDNDCDNLIDCDESGCSNMINCQTICGPPTNNNKFSIKNSENTEVAYIDNQGYLVANTVSINQGTLSPTSSGNLIIEYENDVIAYFNSNGDLYLKGDINEGSTSTPSPSNNFIIKNGEDVVAYIDSSGNLYLDNCYVENA